MHYPRSGRKVASPKSADVSGSAPFATIPTAFANFEHAPDSGYVRLPVVCALFSVSPATVWRWARRGRIPSPRKLSEGVSAWNVGELRQVLNKRGQQ